MSFKKSMLAVLTVMLLMAVAVVVPVTGTNASASTGIQGISDDDDPFEFNGYNKTTSGAVDVYRMSETVQTEELFGYVPDGYGTTTSVSAVVTVNNEMRSIGFDVGLLSGGKVMMTHSESISATGVESDDAWLMNEIPMIGGGTAQTMNVVAYVQESWDLIQVLQDLLPKVSSSAIKEKVEAMLTKAVVKRIITAAASAVIPGIGWAIAIINLGLAAYDLYQLNGELRELVELAEVDVNGFRYDSDSQKLYLAKRYCGQDSREYNIEHCSNVDYYSKTPGQYYVAFILNNVVYITEESIEESYAVTIMSIESAPNELNVYSYNSENAFRVAQLASGNTPVGLPDDGLHENLLVGMMHYHHANHDHNNYPAHAFYGEPMYIGGN